MVLDPSRKQDSEHTGLAEFAENLAFLFGSSGKGAIPLADVIAKLALGSKSPLSTTEIVYRIKRLADLLPEWLQLVTSGSVQIVKVNKSYGVKRALSELSSNLSL
jgi:predicted Zn-dependent peptidase